MTLLLITSGENLVGAAKFYGAVGEWVKTPDIRIDSEDKTVYNSGVVLLNQQLDKQTLDVQWQIGVSLASDLPRLTLAAFRLLS